MSFRLITLLLLCSVPYLSQAATDLVLKSSRRSIAADSLERGRLLAARI